MSATRLVIPPHVRFADLDLSRLPSGEVSFSWEPIEAICEASGLDLAVFREACESNVAGLIIAWYAEARRQGEPVDPVAEALITEAFSEHN